MIITLSSRSVVVNDPEAAAFNAAAIQQAIDDIASAGCGTVEFDAAGDYEVAFAASIGLQLRSNVELRGQREGTKLKLSASSVKAHLINMEALRYVSIVDLSIDGNREAFAKGGAGVHCIRSTKGSYGLRITGCIIRGAAYYGIGMQWNTELMVPEENFLISDNEIYECGGWSSAGTDFGDGIDVKYGREGVIRNNRIWNVAQRGIDPRGMGIRVEGNYVRDSGSTGITGRGNCGLAGYPITNPGKMVIAGNHVVSAGEIGIAIFEETGQTQEGRYIVADNIVEGCAGSGIEVSGPNVVRGVISGNVSRSNGGNGNISASAYSKVIVSGNQSSSA